MFRIKGGYRHKKYIQPHNRCSHLITLIQFICAQNLLGNYSIIPRRPKYYRNIYKKNLHNTKLHTAPLLFMTLWPDNIKIPLSLCQFFWQWKLQFFPHFSTVSIRTTLTCDALLQWIISSIMMPTYNNRKTFHNAVVFLFCKTFVNIIYKSFSPSKTHE